MTLSNTTAFEDSLLTDAEAATTREGVTHIEMIAHVKTLINICESLDAKASSIDKQLSDLTNEFDAYRDNHP